jgi:hypothetical protein
MKYLISASMACLVGGSHALQGAVVDEEQLHKPEELIELGAIAPIGETTVATVDFEKMVKDATQPLEAELEELRAFKASMTGEEREIVQGRIDEAKEASKVNTEARQAELNAMTNKQLHELGEGMGLKLNARANHETLVEAILDAETI